MAGGRRICRRPAAAYAARRGRNPRDIDQERGGREPDAEPGVIG